MDNRKRSRKWEVRKNVRSATILRASRRGPIRSPSQKGKGQNAFSGVKNGVVSCWDWGLSSLLFLPSSCLDLCFLTSGFYNFNFSPTSDPLSSTFLLQCQLACFAPWLSQPWTPSGHSHTHTSNLNSGQASQTPIHFPSEVLSL